MHGPWLSLTRLIPTGRKTSIPQNFTLYERGGLVGKSCSRAPTTTGILVSLGQPHCHRHQPSESSPTQRTLGSACRESKGGFCTLPGNRPQEHGAKHHLQVPLALPRAQLVRATRRSDPLDTSAWARDASEERAEPVIFTLSPADQLVINKSLAQSRQGHMIAFSRH